MFKSLAEIICYLIKIVLFFATAFLIISFFNDNIQLPTEAVFGGIIGFIYFGFKLFSWANGAEKRKCPICKSENIELDSVKEIDRWLGKTKVREKMASGKIRERYVQCTKVKKRYTYCCQNPNCKHTYSEIREEEK